jgi:hypothetical protein
LALGGLENQRTVLSHFIDEVLNGVQIHSDVAVFYEFSSVPLFGYVVWPLCYILCILQHLFLDIPAARSLGNLINDVFVNANKSETGLDWEALVQSAVFLRCLFSSFTGAAGPLGICKQNERPDIVFLAMTEEYHNIDQVLNFVDKKKNSMRHLPKVYVFVIVFTWAKFPLIDGMLVYWNPLAQVEIQKVVGYQVKLSRAYPKKNVPAGIDSAYLIRGMPFNSNIGRWKCMEQKSIEDLLGYSLKGLIPSNWPVAPDVDGFNEII